MKFTVEDEDRKITVETKKPVHVIWDFKEDILKPLLLAWGYQPETVAELFGEDECK